MKAEALYHYLSNVANLLTENQSKYCLGNVTIFPNIVLDHILEAAGVASHKF